jgi:glycosyltransferase involved in cell wall biosynthesis
MSRAAAFGVADSLCITGALTQAQGFAVVSACDIYVAPMQGNALVEAMAAGKPIVAYDHTWHQNLVNHNHTALLVPYRDVDKMAEAIIFLLRDSNEAKRLGEAAKLHAMQYFGRDSVAKRLLKPFSDAWNTKLK